jgi:hypothetical protein
MQNELRKWLRLVEAANRGFSAAFMQWFSGSKIVDAEGNPLKVYHGTNRDFLTFEVRAESHDTGIYFTADPEYASGYANNFNSNDVYPGANIRPCYLSIKNPAYFLTKPTDIELKLGKRGAFNEAVIQYLAAKGHDGVVVGVTDYEVEIGARSVADGNEVCAFSPRQVRSAITLESI